MALKTVVIALTSKGMSLARRIQAEHPGTEVHGIKSRTTGADVSFEKAAEHLRDLFAAGHPIVGICAAAILIRTLAPHLSNKHHEPPVLAIDEQATTVVPLLGGHHGANELARRLAATLSATPAITTAGDVSLGLALDSPPDGWHLANPDAVKSITADLLAGQAVSVDDALNFIDTSRLNTQPDAPIRLSASLCDASPKSGQLIYHPKKLIVGVGTDRGCPPDQLIDLIEHACANANLSRHAISCIVSLDRKADEPAVHAAAAHFNVKARFLSQTAINTVADQIPNPSDVVLREVGVPGVAEGAALAASGNGQLRVEKCKTARATCAIAETTQLLDPTTIGRQRGHISIIGIGPGTLAWRSAEATSLLTGATDWVGYGLYLDLVGDLKAGQREHRFPLGAEEKRVRHALELAGEGRDVALICSGDAGIYAMAALVFEVLDIPEAEGGPSDAARRSQVIVAPGISAVQAAAARTGAPLGHDFCCISLSDLLTPWSAIEQRVRAAAAGDFVTAFYNPRSKRRREQLPAAMAILAAARPPDTPVIIATDLGRPAERVRTVSLARFDPEEVDMLSLVIVGSSTTRALERGDGETSVYTPRGYAKKRDITQRELAQ